MAAEAAIAQHQAQRAVAQAEEQHPRIARSATEEKVEAVAPEVTMAAQEEVAAGAPLVQEWRFGKSLSHSSTSFSTTNP